MDKPTLPKGTRDFSPQVVAKRQFIMSVIRGVFEKFGFQPLETPAMENLKTLTGKYGDEGDQLLFKILNSGDYLKNLDPAKLASKNLKLITPEISEKGLRYDLTVPFARYVVMNRHEIVLPFKRYQIQPVWRADRPQQGRYREFYQCDADVVGTDSLLCEAEIILMIKDVMKKLAITGYTIRINHREILNGIARAIGAAGKEQQLFVALDKLEKIGEPGVQEELLSKGFTVGNCQSLFALLKTGGKNKSKLESVSSQIGKNKGTEDVHRVFDLLSALHEPDNHIELDISLARGLSYYTGCIFEVTIHNAGIGSVSGGGRYDNLTQAFGSKEKLSGVGISFGIDRLYDAMEELQVFPKHSVASATVLICHFDEPSFLFGLGILAKLRTQDISSEIFTDISKLKKQLDYANKKTIPYVIVIGPEEIKSGMLVFKNMESGEQENLPIEKIIKKLKS